MSMTDDYTTLAQPWAQRPNSRILPLWSNAPWFYAHHGLNWEVVVFAEPPKGKGRPKRKPLLLPVLQKIQRKPGVNGVRDGGDITLLNGQMQREGWQILEPQNYDYITVYPAKGGKYYASKFTKIEHLAGRVIQTFNREESDNWRRSLVHDKKIPLPHVHVLKLLEIELNEKLNNLKDLHLPHVANKQKKLQQKLADLLQAISHAGDESNYVC